MLSRGRLTIGVGVGWLREEPLKSCATWANACGAIAVSRLLCSPEFPTFAELEFFLKHGSPHRALRKDETRAYVSHRLRVAGTQSDIFTKRAIDALRGDLVRERFGQAMPPALYARNLAALCLAERGEFPEAVALGTESIELAEALEVSHVAARALLTRARESLRQALAVERARSALSQAHGHGPASLPAAEDQPDEQGGRP